MAHKTSIEWCDSTFNPWVGCTKVSPGCDHCYAERQMDQRLGRVRWGAGQPRQRTSTAYWRQPERWDKADFRACGFCGWRGEIDTLVDDACPSCRRHEKLNPARRRVFCASLADVFDWDVPTDWRRDLYALIERTPNLDWLLLTKRIGNARAMLGECSFGRWDSMPLPNAWLGATVVNQAEADRDFPKLLATPAAKRFMSIEPMLGPIDLSGPLCANALREIDGGPAIDWVIAGGESGPGARPMHPDWVRSLRDQCQAADVPFMLKQWGEWAPASEVGGGAIRHAICKHGLLAAFDQDSMRSACGECTRWEGLRRAEKRRAGRLLDGREWLESPA